MLYYVPYQAVMQENSSNAKLRLVFDTYFYSTNSMYLNDKLENSPNTLTLTLSLCS